jgi:hypothetical protein
MKRFVAATLCMATAFVLTAAGCKKDDPPPNTANNMQPGMQPNYGQPGQPGYQQPPPGQPGYQQPPPGQPQQPPPAQPANTGFMGLPIPIPGMGGGQPAGGGQGGGQEVANNPSMGAMATPVLTPLQQQHAGQNSRQVGETLAGNLQAGQFIKTQVQLQPGKCYTGVGQGSGGPVVVEIVAQMGNMAMATSQPAIISVLGSGKDCYKNPTPIPVPVNFRVVAQGSGPVSAALYEK